MERVSILEPNAGLNRLLHLAGIQCGIDPFMGNHKCWNQSLVIRRQGVRVSPTLQLLFRWPQPRRDDLPLLRQPLCPPDSHGVKTTTAKPFKSKDKGVTPCQ